MSPFVANVKAVPANVELALKAPAVVIVRAFIPADANVALLPDINPLELTIPDASTVKAFIPFV